MERTNFSILFYVRKSNAKKNGKMPIYLRLTVNGERVEFVLEQDVNKADWDSIACRAKGNSRQARELNDYLDHVKMRIREHRIILDEKNEKVTAQILKDCFLGIKKADRTLLEIIENHNNECKELLDKDYTKGTLTKYYTLKKHIINFIESKYHKDDLFLNELSPETMRNFEYYLKTIGNMQNNSAMKYIKALKKIVRIAVSNRWIEHDPFANLKYHQEEVQIDFLSQDEIDTITNKDFGIERINQVRDIYLFCCYTGMAFIDVFNLKKSDIEEKKGKFWIRKTRQKTKNLFIVPLIKPALEIINKYKQHPTCLKKDCVLPVLSNQKMNSYLKEIADLCLINKRLTTHTARHTFATTVTLANQVSMEVVAKMLGHSSTKMTAKYARVLDDVINKDMEKVYAMFE